MTTRAAIIATVTPGARYEVTNHYITRPDHPCYGTTVRTIERTTRASVTFLRSPGDGFTYDETLQWGKGLEADDDGTIRVYSPRHCPVGPFLTLRPAGAEQLGLALEEHGHEEDLIR